MQRRNFELPKYRPLSCSYYELFELACIRGYSLRLYLKEKQVYEGIACDLNIDREKSEWLLIAQPGINIEIRLDYIERVEALTDNEHFSVLDIENDVIKQ